MSTDLVIAVFRCVYCVVMPTWNYTGWSFVWVCCLEIVVIVYVTFIR